MKKEKKPVISQYAYFYVDVEAEKARGLSDRQIMIKATDIAFSKAVRLIKRCEECNRRENLTCAHNIKRRFLKVRWDFWNAFCLCWPCHQYFEEHPVEFAEFVDGSFAADYQDEIRIKGNNTVDKVDIEYIGERLEICHKINRGETSIFTARMLHM